MIDLGVQRARAALLACTLSVATATSTRAAALELLGFETAETALPMPPSNARVCSRGLGALAPI